ncbi:MAG: hypothetical protein ACXV98_14675 [Ilumatobacteraceae bacterium]
MRLQRDDCRHRDQQQQTEQRRASAHQEHRPPHAYPFRAEVIDPSRQRPLDQRAHHGARRGERPAHQRGDCKAGRSALRPPQGSEHPAQPQQRPHGAQTDLGACRRYLQPIVGVGQSVSDASLAAASDVHSGELP